MLRGSVRDSRLEGPLPQLDAFELQCPGSRAERLSGAPAGSMVLP